METNHNSFTTGLNRAKRSCMAALNGPQNSCTAELNGARNSCTADRNKSRIFFAAGLGGALTGLLIVLIRFVDVAQIGPQGTSIGLSHINRFFFDLTGVNMFWYHVTDWLGLAAIFTAFAFAVAGFVQLVRRRSLLKVDMEILALGGLYILVIGLYVLFEVAVVNYRPIIMPGCTQPEASFPSSHTMLVCVIMGSAAMLADGYVRGAASISAGKHARDDDAKPEGKHARDDDAKPEGKHARCAAMTAARCARWISVAIIAITVVGRLISGVHWFTDIVGGILISVTLLLLYCGVLKSESRKSRASVARSSYIAKTQGTDPETAKSDSDILGEVVSENAI